jgi:hypothetical protein
MGEKNRSRWGKWLIWSIGFIFIMYSLYSFALSFFGTETQAKLTSYRRENGERNEVIRGQYTYVFGYEFEVNGKVYSGNDRSIHNAVFLKTDQSSTMSIRYLKCCPYINGQDRGVKNVLNALLFLIIGLGLIWVSRKI